MLVRDIMTENPITAQTTTTVGELLDLLQVLDIRHIPVLDDGELMGIISDRDLRAVSFPRGADFESVSRLAARFDQPISSLMSADVISVAPDADVREAIDTMIETKVGAVPVVDETNGDLVGIVSYIDVLRLLRDELGPDESGLVHPVATRGSGGDGT